MKYASNRGKKCLYMPHSPTIAADEYKMACDHDGVWVNPFLYDTLFKYEKYLMSIATAVIFPSRNAASSYFDAFDVLRSKTIEFILSGVDVKIDGSTSRSRKRRSLRVLFAGRYVSHKGFDLFNELAEHARNAGNRFDFFSVGIGPISPSKYVSNLGWRKDIYDVVSQHDIIVVPNRIAYFDLLPLEVAAIGKPILFTPVGGNIDQADALDDTICAEAMNVSSLYEGLIKIEENLQKNQNYGAKNSIRYSELFTSEKMAARWLAVLKAL
jgi:glycosyltransferase involved in cell wall biosynthesis